MTPLERAKTFSEELIKKHPHFVVDILDTYEDAELETFVFHLSKPSFGKLLEEFHPQVIARLLCLSLDKVDKIPLKELRIDKIAMVLRHCSAQQRREIISTLPSYQRLYLNILFSYLPTQVGFWMDPKVLSLQAQLQAGDVRDLIRKRNIFSSIDHVIVIDHKKFPLGTISFSKLLSLDEKALIGDSIKSLAYPIHANTDLLMIKDNRGWSSRDFMCVVDKKNQLIGILRHLDLRGGLKWLNRYAKQDQQSTPLPLIIEAFGTTFLELCDLVKTVGSTEENE